MRCSLMTLLIACSGTDDPPDPTADDADPLPTADTSAGVPTGDTATPPVVTEPVGTAEPLEICINEFMPANTLSLDVGGTYPDWIELHNPGPSTVDLLGWSLTDDRDDWQRHLFTTSLVLNPGDFVVLYADSDPSAGPEHLSFNLDRNGEELALFRSDGSAEILTYGAVIDDLAVVRLTDCGPIGDWEHRFGGSPGASNQ